MNDANHAAAAVEAATAIDSTDGRVPTEVEAYVLACIRYNRRTGEWPNAGQRTVLLQQVRRGYIDGRENVSIDHGIPAPDGLDIPDLDWIDGSIGKGVTRTASDLMERARTHQFFHRVTGEKTTNARELREAAERAARRVDGLTIAEAAEASGYSERAIRARVDRGTLRSWKGPDNRRRIPRVDLIHAGILQPESAAEQDRDTPASGSTAPEHGSSNASEANAASTAPQDMSALAAMLWEKAEQAVREAAEHRLLAVQADTRLQEAEATAKRFEDALHAARAEASAAREEAAAARAEADALRQGLVPSFAATGANGALVSSKVPAHESDRPRRRWWGGRR